MCFHCLRSSFTTAKTKFGMSCNEQKYSMRNHTPSKRLTFQEVNASVDENLLLRNPCLSRIFLISFCGAAAQTTSQLTQSSKIFSRKGILPQESLEGWYFSGFASSLYANFASQKYGFIHNHTQTFDRPFSTTKTDPFWSETRYGQLLTAAEETNINQQQRKATHLYYPV